MPVRRWMTEEEGPLSPAEFAGLRNSIQITEKALSKLKVAMSQLENAKTAESQRECFAAYREVMLSTHLNKLGWILREVQLFRKRGIFK